MGGNGISYFQCSLKSAPVFLFHAKNLFFSTDILKGERIRCHLQSYSYSVLVSAVTRTY